MEKLYNSQHVSEAQSLIGKPIYYFVRTMFPETDQQRYCYMPMIMPGLIKTEVIGITLDVKRIGTSEGLKDEFRNLRLTIRNPHYVYVEPPSDEYGPSFPPPTDYSSEKTWSLSFQELGISIWETIEAALNNIQQIRGGYLPFDKG